MKYLLHNICDKVALNVFQFCQERDLFPEDDDREDGSEQSQEEEAQSHEYHNPSDPKSRYWDPSWIRGIIITINVP